MAASPAAAWNATLFRRARSSASCSVSRKVALAVAEAAGGKGAWAKARLQDSVIAAAVKAPVSMRRFAEIDIL
jgi:hypothetical protein